MTTHYLRSFCPKSLQQAIGSLDINIDLINPLAPEERADSIISFLTSLSPTNKYGSPDSDIELQKRAEDFGKLNQFRQKLNKTVQLVTEILEENKLLTCVTTEAEQHSLLSKIDAVLALLGIENPMRPDLKQSFNADVWQTTQEMFECVLDYYKSAIEVLHTFRLLLRAAYMHQSVHRYFTDHKAARLPRKQRCLVDSFHDARVDMRDLYHELLTQNLLLALARQTAHYELHDLQSKGTECRECTASVTALSSAKDESELQNLKKQLVEMRARDCAKWILKNLAPSSPVVLTDFESNQDFVLLKKEDVEEGLDLEIHRAVTKRITELVTQKSNGQIRVTSRVINTSDYFRWLARTQQTNTPQARANFVRLTEIDES